MELRHYIIFVASAVLLQLFIYLFNRTLYWLFSGKIEHKTRHVISLFTYVSANSVVLLTILRIQPMFRLSALILICLLFSAFISIGLALAYRLLKNRIAGEKLNFVLRLLYPVGFFGLLGVSVYNAYTTEVIHYNVTLDKPMKPIRIGVASDFHLGKLFGGKKLDELAEIFKREKVDMILLPGDIMDDNVKAYLAENMQPHLAKLRAPLGVYATLGNHDFFGHQAEIEREIRKAGITLIMDDVITVNNEFVIIGRNDDLDRGRLSAQQLLKKANTSLPVLLMDHRPTEINLHSKLPIDVQVSGHAHKGQVFPASIITKFLYRLDYGYEKIGNGHFFVTSGYGFWGIPMRLGSQSEVFIIDVKGK
ncbi:MAG TPA: metallophosphoesterase [Pasteurellaceae bacterium]|nr:metallophosphoesterase [Pasteurellaceae bacterium]